jgi:hypothetical protein
MRRRDSAEPAVILAGDRTPCNRDRPGPAGNSSIPGDGTSVIGSKENPPQTSQRVPNPRECAPHERHP